MSFELPLRGRARTRCDVEVGELSCHLLWLSCTQLSSVFPSVRLLCAPLFGVTIVVNNLHSMITQQFLSAIATI